MEHFSLEEKVGIATALGHKLIDIDGRLEEASWENALILTDFIQQNPDEAAPATERTEIRILYSRDSMYIGVRAFDSEHDKIKAILSRRDTSSPSDWIKIWIDSYHDHLSAFEFDINPAGVKKDIYWSYDYKKDEDWDAVWHAKVSQDEEGWIAEFRIPFSQIRFPEKDDYTWGFQACRVIARKNEISYWRHVPKGISQFVSLFGDLIGIRGIPSPKRLQLLPYSVGRVSFRPEEEGNPFQPGTSYLADLGLDLKYGLSSNLTLDATFNPDFGQVEADPAQVNLTAYETYFSEKRPFFIEGKNFLKFPLGSGGERESLFYSRRIGRAPQGDPSSCQYSQIPERTTILGALKLTGKIAHGLSVGLMEALTGRERARVVTWDEERIKETVEPLTNYFLGRIEKEFKEGRSALGLIFTAVNRKIEDESMNFLRKAAYSGGFDFRHRWARDTYEISGFFLRSQILGSKEAILEAQESSARYFQRPDAAYVKIDPNRTSLSGMACAFSFAKIGRGHWQWSIGAQTRSPGFEINDMGYMRDADEITQNISISYREYKPGKILRDYDINLSLSGSWDYSYSLTRHRGGIHSNFTFLNYWSINFNINRSPEYLNPKHLRGGPALLIPGNWSIRGGFESDSRKDFSFSLNGNVMLGDHGLNTYRISSVLTLRPSGRMHLSLRPSLNYGSRALQYMTVDSIDDQTHDILSGLDQTTVSLTLRINYALTPNLSLQLYSQTYVSAGDYSEFKEVVSPRAENYSDRWHIFKNEEISYKDGYYHLFFPGGEEVVFENPSFNFRQFRLNFLLRWEYLPGSILCLVWTNGIIDNSAEIGTLSLKDDLKNLFTSPSNNVFLLKISYWFNI